MQNETSETSEICVLVVEDEVLVAWDETQTLEDAGYKVIGPAHCLESAQALATSEELSAAVLDVNLGRDTVWSVADTLRARGVPVAFVTADLHHPELGTRFADIPRLTKPISDTELLQVVETIIAASS
ncbi:response regulator [Altererythrobacter confluentis]|uniref:Response regulator n=1 Tax=Allopontixanthobacter confluentis TaxID=1849021 RepID=A0A6L7GJ06_9SPHN|nr:response regulator [Allopontixanthobacter confluentis]MXP14888.1 response regulator [Allopontixanthobacter confluentis]